MEPTLTSQERERALHHRAARSEALTEAEREILEAFYQKKEREESEALASGVQRQEKRLLWLATRRQELEMVAARQQAFNERLEKMLTEAQADRQSIAQDYQRILQTR